MNYYKNGAYGITFLYAIFILSFEPSYYNDDSLFLTQGINNFSVIDFSPHFPGYATVVILGKVINFFVNDAKYSMFILSSSLSASLPLLLFFYIKHISNEKKAFVVFLISISSIYLNNLSLSMLSDGIGLFFFFLSLYLYSLNHIKFAGIIVSVAFFARPSYIILFISSALYTYFQNKNTFLKLLLFFGIGTTFFLGYTFFYNKQIYITEAIRFIHGHFDVWGRGQMSQFLWSDVLLRYENLPYALLFLALYKYKKRLFFYWFLFFTYFFWIIIMQNPDNLRHIIPLIFLSNIIIVLSFRHSFFVLFIFLSINMYAHLQYKEKLSPIEQITKTINENDTIVITNRGVEILRQTQKNRVIDKYYKNSANFAMQNSKTIIITTKKPENTKFETFKGRFIGEHDYYLIRNYKINDN